MSSGGSLLVYLEVPNDCKDAVQLMDLRFPHFAKCMRRVMKKLDKNGLCAETPLTKEENGSIVPSEFSLTCYREAPNPDVLFARLPNGEGGFEICQLSFVRLSVKKLNSQEGNEQPSSATAPPTQSNSLDSVFKQFSQKLDNIDSAIHTLVINSKSTNGPSQKSQSSKILTTSKTPSASPKPVNTPKKTNAIPAKPATTIDSPTKAAPTPSKPATATSKAIATPGKSTATPLKTGAAATPGKPTVAPSKAATTTPAKSTVTPSNAGAAATTVTPKVALVQPTNSNATPTAGIVNSSNPPSKTAVAPEKPPYIPNKAFLKSVDHTIDHVLNMIEKGQDAHFFDIVFPNSLPEEILENHCPEALFGYGPSVDIDDQEEAHIKSREQDNIHITFTDLPNHITAVPNHHEPKKSKKRPNPPDASPIQSFQNFDQIKRIKHSGESGKRPKHGGGDDCDNREQQTVDTAKKPWYYGLIDTTELNDDSNVQQDESFEEPTKSAQKKKHKHKHKRSRVEEVEEFLDM